MGSLRLLRQPKVKWHRIFRRSLGTQSLFLAVLLGITSSCGSQLPTIVNPGRESPQTPQLSNEKKFFEGTLKTLDHANIDLGISSPNVKVLIFPDDLCTECQIETAELSMAITEFGQLPSNVSFYTVLLADEETTRWWKENFRDAHGVAHPIQWTVGYETDLSLFKNYCSDTGRPAVPCLVIQHPHDGIIFKKIGRIPIDQLKSLTGEWRK